MRPARQSDLRARNLATVLGSVAGSAAPVSRAALAARTGLTRATVSALVEVLLDGGLLAESAPPPPTGAGRPAVGLHLSGERVAALGVEVGVDHLAACVRDLSGAVRLRRVQPAEHRGSPAPQVLARSAALAADLVAEAGREGLAVVGATWAVPGLVERGSGRVLLAPNLGWRDVDAVALLGAAADLAGLPVAVGNEAALAAVAELGPPGIGAADGAGAGASDFVLVTGEVGIGAGLVLGGRPVTGARGWSGELGHVSVVADGPECSCGSRGCLEVYAGQEALLRAAGLQARAATALGGSGALAALLAAAEAGDAATLAALARAGRALGLATSAAVNVLDVGAVVLGGIYAPLAPWLCEHVERELALRVLRARLDPVRVLVSSRGPDAAMLGAAAVVLQRVLERPAELLAPAS
ncbi:ROK family transcriptional regulator [Quadrisphaera sp. DSM 44207]|uniref:ROK family transcriptional regulator n=1 Tax=Quadrisphaera sp. DSM 44207 TaxID=1881057 RepID=UPI00088190A4|nr:ROK family transcriptional regulator [Quadrisphaera sp. DSM 44207]SDQ64789.1 Sugar kinase of the NBD/HSP70 family, may contain an N-terminal HTH domain [Quadrisphaera sp. DSM 44207]